MNLTVFATRYIKHLTCVLSLCALSFLIVWAKETCDIVVPLRRYWGDKTVHHSRSQSVVIDAVHEDREDSGFPEWILELRTKNDFDVPKGENALRNNQHKDDSVVHTHTENHFSRTIDRKDDLVVPTGHHASQTFEHKDDSDVPVVEQTIGHNDGLVVPIGDHASRTIPPHYPAGGLGETIDISKDFDSSYFNQLCTNDSSLVAILAIHSASGEFDRRKAVRETLGRECVFRKCRLFFVVGVSKSKTTYNQIIKEYTQENDILMVPKLDQYRHLSNKVYAAMEWVVQYCTSPAYFIHMNDDMFVNLGYFYNRMSKMTDQYYIHCFKLKGSWPFRHAGAKWFVSEEEYPYQYYPDFCLGAVYAFPNVLSRPLFEAMKEAEFCWPDDVWFTGLVRLKTNIRLEQLRSSFNQYHHIHKTATIDIATAEDIIMNQNFVFLHEIDIEEYYTLYNVSMFVLMAKEK